jgi:nucleotide-binding universal stress UspA family protein
MHMEIKKILWPTDLSAKAAQALPTVRWLAQTLGAEVHMVYVAEGIRDYDHIYGDANPAFLKGFQDQENQRALAKMEAVCQGELAGCPLISRHLRSGYPPREILRLAREIGAGLIVMATQGRNYNEGHGGFLGSVSERVVRYSALPVMLINPTGLGYYPDLAPQTPRGHED